MTQRQGQSWFRLTGLLVGGVGAALLLTANPAAAGGKKIDYRGAATLSLIAVGPNVARCGAAPNLELTFEGSGIDLAGGITTIESSACQNPATGQVFDLEATDTYAGGDTISLSADTFFLEFNPETCASGNTQSVRFEIDGGTGIYANIEGDGKFEMALNDPNCNGQFTPAYVWFKGKLH